MDVEGNINEVRRRIAEACERSGRSPEEITVVAATKTVSIQLIQQAFEFGISNFGENRVQDARSKVEQLLPLLKSSPTWHMIGHLQSNKVGVAVRIFDIIQGIDSVALAQAVNARVQHRLPVLLEVNVAGEATKTGFSVDEAPLALRQVAELPNLEVMGLMTIAPLTHNPEEARPIFRRLRLLRDSLGLEHLSMGMTDDFDVAIEEGATMVRIGRAIFGERG